MCTQICPGKFHGGEIEPGTFHGGEIEPGTFHRSLIHKDVKSNEQGPDGNGLPPVVRVSTEVPEEEA